MLLSSPFGVMKVGTRGYENFFVAKLWLYKNNLTFVFAIQNKHLGHI